MKGYYYCSLDTFLNIMKNREIYLSDPLKMNDKLEIKWYLDRLNDDKDMDEGYDPIFEMMKIRSGIEFTFDDLVDRLESQGQKSVYIACFSKKPDLLSLWRAYADDGKGVSIGFDLDKLAVADNFLVREIKYTNSVVQGKLENDVEVVADEIGTVIREHNITDKEKEIDVFLHELIPVLAQYKNPAFSEENEIRLIYCDDLKFEKIVNHYGAFQEEWKNKELVHEFRTIGDRDITEFVKLKFEPSAITDIYMGPKCLLSENDVLNIYHKLIDKEPNIARSKASYR